MLQSVLLPLDRSALSKRGLPFAIRLSRAANAELTLVHAVSPVASGPQPPRPGEAAEELAQLAIELRPLGLRVRTCVQPGPAASVILQEARTRPADLIVMGTHGQSGRGRVLYGQVTDQVLRHTDRPVLLVPPAAEPGWISPDPLRFLIALDGSAAAEAVMGSVRTLAQVVGAELYLLQVISPSDPRGPGVHSAGDWVQAERYLRGVADRVRPFAMAVHTLVVSGRPELQIGTAAQEIGAHLIALTTYGRSGGPESALSPTATDMLQQATTPLLIVRPAGVPPAGRPERTLTAVGH